eukprot:TRINITY_DN17846_c0_g1_i1.p1 TRINITY_DN17846_c0_g1~~TRINITY_DN17846_c0_g1_i1.p1  ORF type:complete len:110 (-),score=1.34 TRINITY_DN17846_c0_g1_i1:10-339(-)
MVKQHNNLTRFIDKQYPKISEMLIAAAELLSRRILPPLNLNHALSNTICDSLNDFAAITLSSHSFARKTVGAMSDIDKCQIAPIQFDLWIVPQATCASKKPSIFNEEEV